MSYDRLVGQPTLEDYSDDEYDKQYFGDKVSSATLKNELHTEDPYVMNSESGAEDSESDFDLESTGACVLFGDRARYGSFGVRARLTARFLVSSGLLYVAASVMVGLASGTPNGFNGILTLMHQNLNLSDSQADLVSSLGLVGLFFTIPAGFLIDRFGSFPPLIGGGLLTFLGYIGMSFCTSSTWWLLAILFTLVGFGSGTTFIAALSTSIRMLPNNTGVAVAFTGGAMSLSMAWVGAVIAAYANSQGCALETGDTDCWRGQLRLVALICVMLITPTVYVFWLSDRARDTAEEGSVTVIEDLSSGKSEEFGQIQLSLEDTHDGSHPAALPSPQETPVTLLESLRIVLNVFFLILSFSFMVGIGAGLLVVTKTSSLWSSFTMGQHESWTTAITVCFSIANACIGGGISGILSDALQKRGISRQYTTAVIFMVFSTVYFAIGGMQFISEETRINNSGVQVVYMLLIIVTGMFFGTNFVTFPSMVGEFYGHLNFGVYFGYMQVLTAVSTFAVPALATFVFKSNGNYGVLYFLFGDLMLACGLAMFLKKPTPVGTCW
mmetsp:Transcript_32871/g.82561  ORF Transcript_32871/g.82561 Transcript_32871/m.82561 type:complete len:553 (-) Transcript_32871:56-1714(-)